MHNSRNDQIVRFTGWFANVQRLRNITGATVFCQQPLRNPPRSRRPPCRRRVQDLAECGIGHKLYFAFLRNTALAFTALSAALAAPLAALYLAHGTFFAADGLPRISLGNYGPLYEEGAARAADGVRPIHFFWSSAAAALCAKRARPAQPTGCAPSTFFKVRFEVTDDMPERATAEAPSTFAPEYLCTRACISKCVPAGHALPGARKVPDHCSICVRSSRRPASHLEPLQRTTSQAADRKPGGQNCRFSTSAFRTSTSRPQ